MVEFSNAMQSAGIAPPVSIIPDGKLQRFHVEGDKPRSKNGWYVLHDDPPAGAFGWWREGINETWSKHEYKELSAEDKARYKANMEAAKREREQEQQRIHAECREKSLAIWNQAEPAPTDHSYTTKKGIKNGYGLRVYKGMLVVPVRDGNTLHGLQFITADGEKRFKSGTNKTGHYYGIGGKPESILYLAEGFATAATIHEATGQPVAVCFDAGNLKPVAEALRAKLPDIQLVICADNDQKTEGNPGVTKATKAAEAANGLLAIPEFTGNSKEQGSDFNDLMQVAGIDEVRRQIAAAGPRISEPAGWPEPLPLPNELCEVESFDFKLFPDTLRPWAEDICERIQCPPDFVAVGVMSALGAVIGRKIGIRPQTRTDWTVVANQWGLVVGRPGVLKSPALDAALAPLKKLAAAANNSFSDATEDYSSSLQVAKLKADVGEKTARKELAKNPDADVLSLLSVEKPDEPTLKRYMANDTSPAALGELLRQNHNGLLVFRDELVSLLRSLDREDQAEGRGFYLTGWNGDSGYTFDRIGRGMNLEIPAVCISLLGSTQPGRLSEYVRQAVKGGAADDGLIQRFGLMVWPDTGGKWKNVDRWPDSEAKQEAQRVFDSLDEFDPQSIGAHQDTDHNGEPEGIPYLRFDEAGHELFLEWRTGLEDRLRTGGLHPALESHLAKYRKLVPGLALIIHLAEGSYGPVDEPAVLKALAWSEYLESHANRAYGSVSQPETVAAKAILLKVHQRKLGEQFSVREIQRNGWAGLSDRLIVQDGLQLLVDYDWLAEERKETGGRPTTIYTVNPRGLK